MEIKLKNQISGTRNGEDWPEPGTIVDLPDDEAETLLKNGDAVAVDVELPDRTGGLTKAAVAGTEPEEPEEPVEEPQPADEEPKAKGRRASA